MPLLKQKIALLKQPWEREGKENSKCFVVSVVKGWGECPHLEDEIDAMTYARKSESWDCIALLKRTWERMDEKSKPLARI